MSELEMIQHQRLKMALRESITDRGMENTTLKEGSAA
jgi:hypothetical protein